MNGLYAAANCDTAAFGPPATRVLSPDVWFPSHEIADPQSAPTAKDAAADSGNGVDHPATAPLRFGWRDDGRFGRASGVRNGAESTLRSLSAG